MDKLNLLLRSRKFWAAVAGLAMLVIKAYLPNFSLGEEQLTAFVVVIVGYILGVAVEDAGARR